MLDLVASAPLIRAFACCSFNMIKGRPYSSEYVGNVKEYRGQRMRDESQCVLCIGITLHTTQGTDEHVPYIIDMMMMMIIE